MNVFKEDMILLLSFVDFSTMLSIKSNDIVASSVFKIIPLYTSTGFISLSITDVGLSKASVATVTPFHNPNTKADSVHADTDEALAGDGEEAAAQTEVVAAPPGTVRATDAVKTSAADSGQMKVVFQDTRLTTSKDGTR